ncbi:hypothetical protein MHYP_G00033350 [Metynnis hypsauchen]
MTTGTAEAESLVVMNRLPNSRELQVLMELLFFSTVRQQLHRDVAVALRSRIRCGAPRRLTEELRAAWFPTLAPRADTESLKLGFAGFRSSALK